MIAYLDTSAVLKQVLLDEAGLEVVEAMWTVSDALVTSRLTYPEARAAIASATAHGRLSKAGGKGARRSFDALFAQLDVVELDPVIASAAGDVAERLRLRAADSIHLASAHAVADPPAEVVVVTWDVRLARAAGDTGLAVAPALEPSGSGIGPAAS